ncbi:GNAT family N-acetyltransferase [Amycolatopsis sp. cmx-4-68]|uniref:GNAT family N-acetyltransferase n=1 Tax=Amycolatopsis sp. cmx-4-68 TaxID=2790938 RepID=UPI00397840F9
MTAAPPLTLHDHDAAGMHELRDLLIAVYTEVYADLLGDPFFSPERYWQRLESYAKWPGFALVTGWLGDDLIGYTLGYTLPKGSAWWRGFQGDVPPGTLEEDSQRTFAVTQLMVLPAHQRRGYAGQLHDALLANRPEERATLLVKPDNVPARTAYLSWGWLRFGRLQPFDDAPVYDSLIYPLPKTN